jgi:drug/metabolite transporter (DMT)-like permease
MLNLLIVSLIWAFSFGLIKSHLSGLDPNFLASARLVIALPIFLLVFRPRGLNTGLILGFLSIGAIQYGFMYCFYLLAFRFLPAYLVALFTIFTPIYVIIIDDLFERRLHFFSLAMAALAVIGAGIIYYRGSAPLDALAGFVLMQLSNLCFAFGQIAYRRQRKSCPEIRDLRIYALLFIGAAAVTAAVTTVSSGWRSVETLDSTQWMVLIYLGVLASGIGFFLWNKGALQVNTATLAVFNNLKIPLAVCVSLVFFRESANLSRLAAGGGLMIAALAFAENRDRRRKAAKSYPPGDAKNL